MVKVRIFKVRTFLEGVTYFYGTLPAQLLLVTNMFELIRIESLLTESILKKNSYKHFRPIKSRFVSNKCIILNRPMIFTSRLRYRLFGVLSDIRWVVNNVLVSRRMDTQNKYKARLAP